MGHFRLMAILSDLASVALMIGTVVAVPGCGGSGLDTVAVRGRVTYNGEPLVGGTVSFYPVERDRGRPAKAAIQPDGSYVVETLADTSGIVPGDYKVGVVLRKLPVGGATPAQIAAAAANKMELPKRFANPETSGLSFTVEPGYGTRTYDIQLSDSSD